MARKKYIPVFLTALIILACGKNSRGDELSRLSLYSGPDKIIATLTKNGGDYLANYILAKAYMEKKEPKNAILYFANSCFKSKFNYNMRLFPQPVYAFVKSFSLKSPYYNDSIFYIASIFFDYGEHDYVTRFIDLMKEDDSVLYRDAILLKTKSMQKLNRGKEAVEQLNDLLGRYNDRESIALSSIRLGSVYESMEENTKAVSAYIKVITSGGDKWHLDIAAKRLVFLKEQKKIKFSAADLLLLAGALFDTGDLKKSGEYTDLLLKEKNGAASVLKLKILTITRYAESLKLLETMKNDPAYQDILLTHANLLWDKGNKAEAIKNYITLSDSEDGDIRRRVLTRIIFYMEERSRPEFIPFAEKYAASFPGDKDSARFLWLCGRFHLKNKSYDKASLYFTQAIKKFPDADYTSYCRFWEYRIKGSKTESGKIRFLGDMCFYHPGSPLTLELLSVEAAAGDAAVFRAKYASAKKEAVTPAMILYHTLLFLKEGYNRETSLRVSEFPGDFISPYKSLEKLISSPSYKSSYSKTILDLEKYFAAGDTAAIAREIKPIPENDETAMSDINLAFTVFSSRYSFYNMGTFHAFKLFSITGTREYLSLLPESYAKILYPAPFTDCVLEESRKYKINPSVIYSMIKAESNFNHSAESPVGALGLMQLMPATASGIGRELKTGRYDLKDPCTSIKFGTHYIAWLGRYYKDRIEYMVAGYNAGAGNVDNWIKSGNYPDMDLFSEFTPFYETRDYIFRTKKFIVQYRAIYRW
ncbi:MAG TPA: transglycosylase SLT domain-containing protein [Spirochaetota bacterium]|nr:transglycosylase SLT domain-containing protein [Spirochaetota bacterium]